MGYVIDDALVIVVPGYRSKTVAARLAVVRAKWSEPRGMDAKETAALLVGPVTGVVNDTETWFVAPDASKEGWEESARGDEFRQDVIDALRGLLGVRIVHVRMPEDGKAGIASEHHNRNDEDGVHE